MIILLTDDIIKERNQKFSQTREFGDEVAKGLHDDLRQDSEVIGTSLVLAKECSKEVSRVVDKHVSNGRGVGCLDLLLMN